MKIKITKPFVYYYYNKKTFSPSFYSHINLFLKLLKIYIYIKEI